MYRYGLTGAMDASNFIWFLTGKSLMDDGSIHYNDMFWTLSPSLIWLDDPRFDCQRCRSGFGSTATMSQDNKTIYYIGGVESNTTDPYILQPIAMTNILTFDTAILSWEVSDATGARLPSARCYHTAIYGTLCTYFRYYPALWWFHNCNSDNTGNPATSPVPDSDILVLSHTSVHYKLTLSIQLLYMHGNACSDFHVMDLTHLQWTSVFRADSGYSNNSTKVPSATPISTLESQESGGSNITGIVVGSVVGVAVISVIGALLLVRRVRQLRGHVIDNELSRPAGPEMTQGLSTSTKLTLQEHYDINKDNQGSSSLNVGNQKPDVQMPTIFVMSSAGGYEFGSNKPDGHTPQLTLESTKPDGI
ncbi:hypothetical protein DFQ30_011165 [Apophysomyces sp. BC1015]|nr:hypothetical protein DFQ30_011165 [Apophysomyces sp. BC1015]